MNKTKYPSYLTISLIKIQKKNFIRPVEYGYCFSVAVFLAHARFQNGFLCDFIALLQSCFSRFPLRI